MEGLIFLRLLALRLFFEFLQPPSVVGVNISAVEEFGQPGHTAALGGFRQDHAAFIGGFNEPGVVHIDIPTFSFPGQPLIGDKLNHGAIKMKRSRPPAKDRAFVQFNPVTIEDLH